MNKRKTTFSVKCKALLDALGDNNYRFELNTLMELE